MNITDQNIKPHIAERDGNQTCLLNAFCNIMPIDINYYLVNNNKCVQN